MRGIVSCRSWWLLVFVSFFGPIPVSNRRRVFPSGARVRVGDTVVDRIRPYLENCTVDASIFVAKLVRAHGGCLGTRSR